MEKKKKGNESEYLNIPYGLIERQTDRQRQTK